MAATYRVEWLAVDQDGNQHRYISHMMPQADAEAMAATLRKGKTSGVEVLDADQVHSSLAPA